MYFNDIDLHPPTLFIGSIFENVGKDNPIYPSVGLRTSGEGVRVNFGHEPFKFDIDYHVHRARERTWETIQSASVKWMIDDQNDVFTIEADHVGSNGGQGGTEGGAPQPVEDGAIKSEADPGPGKGDKRVVEEEFIPIKLPQDFQTPINKLVLSYLAHHGYARTARAFQTQCDAGGKTLQGSIAAKERLSFPPLLSRPGCDVNMETDDDPADLTSLASAVSNSSHFGFDGFDVDTPTQDLQSRQRVVNAVLRGHIDFALEETRARHPAVLEREDGLMLFKLRCRKFVELVLEASEALKKVKADAEAEEVEVEVDGGGDTGGRDTSVAMEVDDDDSRTSSLSTNGFTNGSAAIPIQGARRRARTSSRASPSPSVAEYQTALGDALAYGRQLQADYKSDTRPEVQILFDRTFSIVAYDDPVEAGGDVAELASQEARGKLAQDMNQAILGEHVSSL